MSARCEECHSSGQQKGGLSGGLQQSSNQGPDASGAKTQGKKRKAKRRQWREDPEGGPRITGQAGKVLARLLGILTTPSRAHLDDLLSHLLAAELVEPLDLEGAVERVKQLDVGLKHHELNYMLALVQLTLHVHSTKRNAVLKHLPKVTGEALVERFASKVNRKTFLDWLSCGQKLMVLCAAGTMYILPILAALDMRTTITRQCAEEDVISLANALREVKHGQWLSLVRKLMVPIHHLATLPPSVFSKLSLHYNIPKQTGEDPETRHYFFQETEDLDTLFSEIETNYPKLPTRSPEWCSPSIEPWLPYPAPQVSLTNTITTPLVLGKKKMPFIKKNRDKWTEKERAKASKAPVASSLEDLQSRVDVMHEGGKVKPDQYIEVNTRILEGKPLYIRDANGKLLSLAFTVPEHIKKALEDAIMLIQAAMPGEFKDEDSKRALYRYLSCHYTWYARFAEKGEGAPPDVHPNNLRSDNHEGHVNFNQRFPHQSKEIIENREEFLILAQAYQAFFEWLRVQLKHLLPEEFEQLSIWCDALPLGSDSPAAPFGGFVINLNSLLGSFGVASFASMRRGSAGISNWGTFLYSLLAISPISILILPAKEVL
ncbi:hypothetical protein FB451DRAFT_345152 [Mycena latifolia]|nr:hypothetical protein FB451DRAFT_345152 [Mycena latifolia]